MRLPQVMLSEAKNLVQNRNAEKFFTPLRSVQNDMPCKSSNHLGLNFLSRNVRLWCRRRVPRLGVP